MSVIFATLIGAPETILARLTEFGLTEVVDGETVLRPDLERYGHGQSLTNMMAVWDKKPESDHDGITNGAARTGQMVIDLAIKGPARRPPGADALTAALQHAATDQALASLLGEAEPQERPFPERLRLSCAHLGIAYTHAVQHVWIASGTPGTFTGWAGSMVENGAALRTHDDLALVVPAETNE